VDEHRRGKIAVAEPARSLRKVRTTGLDVGLVVGLIRDRFDVRLCKKPPQQDEQQSEVQSLQGWLLPLADVARVQRSSIYPLSEPHQPRARPPAGLQPHALVS